MHFGTGNYNEKTAKLYSDVGYMTTDADLGADASAFFTAIAGYSEPQNFTKLEMAPIGLRERLAALIDAESERKREGQEAVIRAKMNSLVDTGLIEALYRASKAGVKIQLNVRGICCLCPGVKGLSENISVLSIVDRFLEHSRIFYFRAGGRGEVYISSADWMPRNLDRRVELLVPVEDSACRRRLISILDVHFRDTVKGRYLQPDGTYASAAVKGRRKGVRSQERLCELAMESVRSARHSRRTVFDPHRPGGGEV
jgi:polyphosphate kinase